MTMDLFFFAYFSCHAFSTANLSNPVEFQAFSLVYYHLDHADVERISDLFIFTQQLASDKKSLSFLLNTKLTVLHASIFFSG
jgi:hypothetical protein